MEHESKAYPGITEPPRPTISSHVGAQDEMPTSREPDMPKPKRKRYKKTLDQQVAAAELRLKALKEKQRKARDHRLIVSASTIESEAGHVELDERVARWLGRVLANELAMRPDGEIARYIDERDRADDEDGNE